MSRSAANATQTAARAFAAERLNQLTRLMIGHGIGVSIKETYHLKRVDMDCFAGDV